MAEKDWVKEARQEREAARTHGLSTAQRMFLEAHGVDPDDPEDTELQEPSDRDKLRAMRILGTD